MSSLNEKANEIISIITELSAVKSCKMYGSLSTNTYDELSDIDIEVDVSGYDNGKFMLEVVDMLKGKLPIYYSDYAPSLIPEKYIVSIAIDEDNPFLIIDISCCANPHCTLVTKANVIERNSKYTHVLKLWTANLKHFVRGLDCYQDIARMAKKIRIDGVERKDEIELLEEALCWLEKNCEEKLICFVDSCRRMFEELVN